MVTCVFDYAESPIQFYREVHMPTHLAIDDAPHPYETHRALAAVSAGIHGQGIVALLGSHGLGKSTFFSVIFGVFSPTNGVVSINGDRSVGDPWERKSRIGYLPQVPPLYPIRTEKKYLKLAAPRKRVTKKRIGARIAVATAKCGLRSVSSRIIVNLSESYKLPIGVLK